MIKITLLIIFTLLSFNVACSAQSVKTATVAPEQKITAQPDLKKPEIKKPAKDLSKAAKECICMMLWMPVCGDDKKTYGNACQAECQGVAFTAGECHFSR